MSLLVRGTRRLLAAAATLTLCLAPCLALAQNAPAAAPASTPAAPTAAPAAVPASAPAAPTTAGAFQHAAAPAMWVVPGPAGPGVYALFPALGASLPPTPFLVDSVNIRQSEAEACFKGPAGLQCLSLLHPSQARANDQRTRHFAVRAPAGTDPALLAAAVASIKQGERDSPWVAVSAGRSGPVHAARRSPTIIVGVVLLLIALWLAARAMQRRGAPPATAASGAPSATPGAPTARSGAPPAESHEPPAQPGA